MLLCLASPSLQLTGEQTQPLLTYLLIRITLFIRSIVRRAMKIVRITWSIEVSCIHGISVCLIYDTDVCKVCEDHRSAIQEAVTEGEKKQKILDFSQHVEEAQKERDAYLEAIEKSKVAMLNRNLRSTLLIMHGRLDLCITKYHSGYKYSMMQYLFR